MNIVAVGECMLELSGGVAQPARLAFGGDTFNTALYLARFGHAPAYLTALGVDPFSEEMLAQWRVEGVRTDLVLRCPGRLPGLYAIRTAPDGERSFFYWRKDSAARALFASAGCERALATAAQADLLYLSGITLSLYSARERTRLCELAAQVRANGRDVAFDPNYRPAGWASREEACAAIAEFAKSVTIALPSLEDEAALWGDSSTEIAAARWGSWGAREVLVKLGANGALLTTDGAESHVPAAASVTAVDTTGAGDSFNAGYLGMRARGKSPAEAARFACKLAAVVVQHPGAIVPRAVTAALFFHLS
jgi:2-dehydro-3-deoxygluconokinase